MSTQKRIDSSNANGAKSRGPVTPEGRARSRAARLTHGLTSGQIVLEYESEKAFNALREEYLAEYQPQTRSRFDLVDHLVAARWRLNRVSLSRPPSWRSKWDASNPKSTKSSNPAAEKSAPPSPTSI